MAEPGTAQHALRQHVVVVGADTTTVRLAEELVRSGEQLVVIAHGDNPRGAIADIEALGCQMIIASQIREAELRAAGVEQARAAVVLGDDDVMALRLGLMIDELAPGLQIVIEMTNPRLGGRLTSLIGDCTLLSSAELAAPAFVAAALATPDTQSFEIGGRTVAAGPRHRIGGELLAVIGDTRRTGIDAVLPQDGGDLVLGTKLIGTARNVARTSGMLGAVSRIFDRRARLVMLGLAALILLSTLYFHIGGRDWLASLYLALTASTATGTGDLSTLPLGFQFGALFIQLFGLVLSAGITAVIVDALIGARLAVILGGVRGKPRHHVVVCGLGRVGTAVAVRLQSRGVPVIAIERRGDAPGVLRARQLKIPVVVAAATNGSPQEVAGISRADAVLAVTDDEAVNLEIALVAKDANPSVRVVARVFDHDLASRVERRFAAPCHAQRLHAGSTGVRRGCAGPAAGRDLSRRAPSAAVYGIDRECQLGGAGPLAPGARGTGCEPDPRLESLFRHELAMGTS